MTVFLYILFFIAHWKNRDAALNEQSHITSVADENKRNSPWFMYKWIIIVYQIVLNFECVIVTTFWLALFPVFLIVYHTKGDTSAMTWLTTIVNHTMALLILVIDWNLNTIQFEYRHFWMNFAFGTVYLLFNIIFSLARNEFIYPIMDWPNDPFQAFFVVCVVICLQIGFFIALKKLTDRKLKKFESV